MYVEECFISERNRWGSAAQLCIHLFDEAKKIETNSISKFRCQIDSKYANEEDYSNGVSKNRPRLSNQITQTSSFDIIN